jgi:hypothetical protein
MRASISDEVCRAFSALPLLGKEERSVASQTRNPIWKVSNLIAETDPAQTRLPLAQQQIPLDTAGTDQYQD